MFINLNIKHMIRQLFVGLSILAIVSCIGVPIHTRQQKCMISYTVGESDTVKISANLPEIPGRVGDQHYEIIILNTETNQTIVQRSYSGLYKRQLTLVNNIIYEVCFEVRSDREFGKIIIQYTAENLFNLDHGEIKVPDNLLKSGGFKQAYQNAHKLFTVTEKFKSLQQERKQSQSQTFVQTNSISSNLVYISVGEIGIILVAAVYQFFTLQRFLSTKNFI